MEEDAGAGIVGGVGEGVVVVGGFGVVGEAEEFEGICDGFGGVCDEFAEVVVLISILDCGFVDCVLIALVEFDCDCFIYDLHHVPLPIAEIEIEVVGVLAVIEESHRRTPQIRPQPRIAVIPVIDAADSAVRINILLVDARRILRNPLPHR